jgi:lambda family phage portal protein
MTPILKAGTKADQDLLRARWLAWTDEADAEGLTDFYGLQRRAAREAFVAGEVFFRFRERRPEDGLTVPLQLQMLPSEMLPLHMNEVAGANVIRQGIEFDPIGRRVAYHFLRRHPGDSTDRRLSTSETVRVPASEVIHVFDPVEAGQIRGVTAFAPAIVKLFMLDVYDDAELDKKKVVAMQALAIETATPEDWEPAEDADGDRAIDWTPGSTLILDPGESAKVIGAADSGASYDPFQFRTLLQISAALGIPYQALTGDPTKANYSSQRVVLVEFRRRVEAFQHGVFVHQLCRRVLDRWLSTAMLAGSLEITSITRPAAKWLPPRWEWVDPLKDANAEIVQINAGLKSRSAAIAERGYDAEEVDEEIAADRDRERRLGLTLTTKGARS